MSNLEWSDDEENDIAAQPDRMFPPSDSESEEEFDYSEINKLILDKVDENKYDLEEKEIKNTKKVKKPKSDKNKITIDWNDLNKPKETKWMSKRMKERKLQDGKIKKVRKFNPRLPVPNKIKIKKEKLNDNIDINDFPEL